MAKIFATTSGKGGVGKSSVAVGLGFAFSGLGHRVLLVDMDEALRCLDLLLGVEGEAVLDLSDAVDSKDIFDVAYNCGRDNLYLIPAPTQKGEIVPDALSRFCERAAGAFDIIIFDFPAGVDFTLYAALPLSTLFLAVATPDPVSVRDAAVVSGRLEQMNLKSRLIINRFDCKSLFKRGHKNIDGIIDSTAIRLLGIIPESAELSLLSVKNTLKRNGKANKAFLRIAGRLLNNNIPLPKIKSI